MEEKYSYEEYIHLTREGYLYNKANKYKSRYIPRKLYKYMSFGTTRNERNKRKKTLENDEIWASNVPILNDPFEFKMLFSSQTDDDTTEFFNDAIYRNEVVSLSGTPLNKLMWSHYANSHKGICLEYDVNSDSQIYPVYYTNIREDISSEIKEWIATKKNIKSLARYMSPESRALIAEISRITYTKDSVWEYEQEFRIVTRNHSAIEHEKYDLFKKQKGSNHKSKDLGLTLSKIILGLNFTEDKLVNNIVEKINCNRCKKIMKEMQYSRLRAMDTLHSENAIVEIAKVGFREDLTLYIQDGRKKIWRDSNEKN